MDIKEYISSGIIEAYVLGIATEEEVRLVNKLSVQYPEFETALHEQEALLGQYAQSQAIEPPAPLKQAIWERIQIEETPIGDNKEFDSRKITFDQSASASKRHRIQYALAASLIFLIVSLGTNLWLMNERTKNEKNISALKTAFEQYQNELKKAQNNLALMTAPQLRKIALFGVGNHQEESGTVYWDTKTGEVYLDLSSMPQAPQGRQYQLWAIVDGKPIDAGLYVDHSKGSLNKMKAFPKADMFAITIEQEGGSATPTLDQMVVAGKTI